jgi:hypothetical protein
MVSGETVAAQICHPGVDMHPKSTRHLQFLLTRRIERNILATGDEL